MQGLLTRLKTLEATLLPEVYRGACALVRKLGDALCSKVQLAYADRDGRSLVVSLDGRRRDEESQCYFSLYWNSKGKYMQVLYQTSLDCIQSYTDDDTLIQRFVTHVLTE
jgi:hypothetical protein